MRWLERWTDQKIEVMIGNLLRTGVLISAALVFSGGVVYLWRQGFSSAEYGMFVGEPSDLRTFNGIVNSAFRLSARGLIQFGLLLLIATPVARVAVAVIGFAAEKDRMYVAFTLIVLVVLLLSFTGVVVAG